MKSRPKYKKTLQLFTLAWFAFVACFYMSCSNSASTKKADTLTSGEVTIYADEAYTTLLNDLRFIYQINYPESAIKFVFTGEEDALDKLVKDKAKFAVVSEEPSKEIIAHYKKKGFPIAVCPIASDGIILAVNKNCPLNQLTRKQLTQILNGKINTWNQLIPGDPTNQKLVVGFNIKGSGIVSYFRKNYLEANQQFSPNCATFKSSLALLDSVAKYPSIMGFIPFNFISDKDDSLARAIKQNFKIISLQSLKDTNDFVLPSQSSIADSAYPLVRKVLILNHEGKSGLGTGFVIYIASHKGQRLILKAGMVPAVMPGRLVRMVKKDISF